MQNKSLLKLLSLQEQSLQNYFSILTSQLLDTSSTFSKNTETLIQSINLTSKNIYFSGVGKNDAIAEKSANMLRSLNYNCHNIDPTHGLHGDAGMVRDGDIIIAISKSGTTIELLNFLKYIKQYKDVTLFGICCENNSALDGFYFQTVCDFTIELPKLYEIDEFNKVPTTSIIESQLYIDMIAVEASQRKNFTLEEFVASHPGGAIGQTLLR